MFIPTTPTHIFELPLDISLLQEIEITYAQYDKPVLIKAKDQCEIEGNTVIVKLTQEETTKFDDSRVNIQVRVLTTSGEVFASQKEHIFGKYCLSKEILE